MENSNNTIYLDTKVEVAFPKSNEDHRLQLVQINGAMFAILHSPLDSLGPIRLYCDDWSLILLAPIKSKVDVVISATNIICLSEIISEEGQIHVHASHRMVKFGDSMSPLEKVHQVAEGGQHQFGDDPGAFLYQYRLFDSIINALRKGSPDAGAEAQQKFIASLSLLADKMEGKSKNLNLHEVLTVWGIPHLKA